MTAYVILGAIGVALALVLVALLVRSEEPTLAVILLALLLPEIPILIGLWLMKNWARVVVICLQVLSLASGVLSLLLGGYADLGGLCGGLLGLALSGYIVYWFATHRADFEPPPGR